MDPVPKSLGQALYGLWIWTTCANFEGVLRMQHGQCCWYWNLHCYKRRRDVKNIKLHGQDSPKKAGKNQTKHTLVVKGDLLATSISTLFLLATYRCLTIFRSLRPPKSWRSLCPLADLRRRCFSLKAKFFWSAFWSSALDMPQSRENYYHLCFNMQPPVCLVMVVQNITSNSESTF